MLRYGCSPGLRFLAFMKRGWATVFPTVHDDHACFNEFCSSHREYSTTKACVFHRLSMQVGQTPLHHTSCSVVEISFHLSIVYQTLAPGWLRYGSIKLSPFAFRLSPFAFQLTNPRNQGWLGINEIEWVGLIPKPQCLNASSRS